MIPKRSPRIVALLIAGTLVGALFASPVSAKPPAFTGSAPPSPDMVSPSTDGDTHYVRFDVSFKNESNSAMQQVTMTADTPPDADTPAVSDLVDASAFPKVDGVEQGTCSAAGEDLSCTIGTVSAGSTVTLWAVYTVPTDPDLASLEVDFLFKSTGAPQRDPRRSHGDDFLVPGTVPIASGNFAGTYAWDADNLTIQTNQELSRRGNPQSTKVTGPVAGIPLQASEVAANEFNCPEVDEEGNPVVCFGQWSVLNVDNDTVYPDGFRVVIAYDSVPGNAAGHGFVHLVGPDLDEDGNPDGSTFITEMCDADEGPTTNCIVSIELIGGDIYYTINLDNNGPIRGI